MQAEREEVVFGEDVYLLLLDVTCFLIEERVSSCYFQHQNCTVGSLHDIDHARQCSQNLCMPFLSLKNVKM